LKGPPPKVISTLLDATSDAVDAPRQRAHHSTSICRTGTPCKQLRPARSNQGARDRCQAGTDPTSLPDPGWHGQSCIPRSRLAIVSQGRHAAPAVSPAAFNEVPLGFLKDNR